jgi:hypothetical protein
MRRDEEFDKAVAGVYGAVATTQTMAVLALAIATKELAEAMGQVPGELLHIGQSISQHGLDIASVIDK